MKFTIKHDIKKSGGVKFTHQKNWRERQKAAGKIWFQGFMTAEQKAEVLKLLTKKEGDVCKQ